MAGGGRPLPGCPARVGAGRVGVDGAEFVFHAADCGNGGNPVTEIFGFFCAPGWRETGSTRGDDDAVHTAALGERYRLLYCRVFHIPLANFGQSGPVSSSPADGSPPGGIPEVEQAAALLARLPHVEVPDGNPDLRTIMQRLHDPAGRDDLCFLLGYATAMMATDRRQNDHPEVISGGIRSPVDHG